MRGSRLRIGCFVGVLHCVLGIAACGDTAPDRQPADAGIDERMLDKQPFPDAVTVRGAVRAKALGDDPIPTDAHVKGMWSAVVDWPLIAIHAALLPDGRVLTYGTDGDGRQTGYFIYDVWNPAAGLGPESHLTLPNQTLTDIFCSSQLVLPQAGAGVFIAGGDKWDGTEATNKGNNNTNVFSYQDNTLTRSNNLLRPRWYSSSTMLLNGEVYIQGGNGGTDRPEVRGVDGVFRLLSGADTSTYAHAYPRNFVAPDGRVFGYDNAGKMYYVDPSGTGQLVSAGQLSSSNAGVSSSAAMFRPGRILQFGGNSKGAVVIDITGGSPVVTATQSMSTQRRHVSGTILPNGRVLATGGSRASNELIDVNNSAEIWNPETGTWLRGSDGALARLYHSNALLLPDATVLVAGGGAPGPLTNLNAEIYYPPYLFTSAGTLAQRPRIEAAPSSLQVGRPFTLDFADAASVSRVVLVKSGSGTHSWNMEQRFVELAFTASGQRLTVQMSSRAADTPPGYYLLFVLDAAGVPSTARMAWINVAGAGGAQNPPVIQDPAAQASTVGDSVSLAVQGSDPDFDPVTFSATGLPPGLSIDASGLISGTPTARGEYSVVVSVSDGSASDAAGFTWTVNEPGGPLELDPLPLSVPAQAGNEVAFAASARGNNPRYKWDFGDGTPETAYSGSGNVSHRFDAPGIFHVAVTVADDSGAQTHRTFLQVVHLPLAARAPTASSTVVYERRSGEPDRVWMVNQDNDSVSVFETSTGTRLAEIAVGTAPRSLAIDAQRKVWVVGKRSWNVKVIDPDSFAVASTVALPRASQPHGIAMTPAGDFAFIALEGTGQVVKYRTSTYAKLLTVGVGASPRHVSVSADGATVYVSRFVTPPQPGESTATVSPGAGGEVLRLRASDLATLGTTTLGFGTRPDAETQGRGVPNYLGAMAMSPDASQGWVPSKQDNIQRGVLRDGQALNFQHTVRAISSRVDLVTGVEDAPARIDHDNSSLSSAAAFDPLGVLLFVALETSREVAVVDAHGRHELFRFQVGRAPQGLVVSPDGRRLYVENFMDRTLGIYDVSPLMDLGELRAETVATVAAIDTDKLTPQVLLGKQLFYDARDTRLAADRYMSCASCHNDGGQDGRVWDLTGFGEGLRNTIALRGRAGAQGFLHWSNNFDEVQDFEGQIRELAGGTGLMDDAAFFAGTRAQPLGDRKTGISSDLDALAAYLASLSTFDYTPLQRSSNTALSSQATAGKTVFAAKGCGTCHAGLVYTGSGDNTWVDIGTRTAASGQRLGLPLLGIDVPTLRDAWATPPYLHDGSALTLNAAIAAHAGTSFSGSELADVAAYVQAIGREEAAPPVPAGAGTGLRGEYFNNRTLTAPAALTRNEWIDFGWSSSPGEGVNADNFSVRWSGSLIAPSTGSYYFQTKSNDGVRLWVNDVLLVDNWVAHNAVTDTSAALNLVAGQTYRVLMEYYDKSGTAVARLGWRLPGTTAYVTIPADRLIEPG